MPRRSLVPIGVLLCIACTPDREGLVRVGHVAPEYEATSLADTIASLAALRGRVVLINMWATWCLPCRTEMPVLQRLHERHEADGLRVVGVSVNPPTDRAGLATFAREFGVTFALWHDSEGRIGRQLATTGVPATYLVARDGTVLWKRLGELREDDPVLLRILRGALDATSPASPSSSTAR